MRPCCESMAASVVERELGLRGLSVELPTETEPTPLLIFRSVDQAHEAQVHADAGAELTIEMKVGFTFCPWCGRRVCHWRRKLR